MVIGGAVPPPQSRKEQISPVPGTYQATEAPAGEDSSVLVQPVRSVLAETEAMRRGMSARTVAGENVMTAIVVLCKEKTLWELVG